MLTTLIVRLSALALLAILMAVAAWAWRWASRNAFFLPLGRRGKGIGKLRIACGVLGALILVAMSLATWQTIRRTYADAHVQVNPLVHVPALPPPPLPTASETLPVVLDKARLLVTVTVLDASSADSTPVSVAQKELDWPAQKTAAFSLEFLGIRCDYTIDVMKLRMGEETLENPHSPSLSRDASSSEQGKPVESQLMIDRHALASWNGPDGMSDSYGSNDPAPAGKLILMPGPGMVDRPIRRSNPLSLAFLQNRYCVIGSVFTYIRADDPLRSVPLREVRPPLSKRSQLWQGMWNSRDPSDLRVGEDAELGAIGLLNHLRMSALLLIAAVVLLAQLFKRRDLAMVGLLLATVLFVVAWDRAMLAYDISWMNDRSVPLSVRWVACERVAQTFFYGHTASGALRMTRLETGTWVPQAETSTPPPDSGAN